MGKRLSIDLLALLDAGCSVIQRIENYPADDQYPAMTMRFLDVTFPITVNNFKVIRSFDFDINGDRLTVSCDYNGWGTSYQILNPLLRDLNIPHSID